MTVQSEVVGPPVAPEKQNVLPVHRRASVICILWVIHGVRMKVLRTSIAADVALPLVEVRDRLAVGVDEGRVGTVGERDLDVLVCADVRGLDDLLVRAVALSDECCRSGAEEGGGGEEELGEEHFVEESRTEGDVGEECP